MSEGSNSDIEDDIDKILNDVSTTPKKPKPPDEEKFRPPLQKQRSNSLEETNGVSPPPPNEEPRKPFALPMSNRPKTNPNANLLGGSLFGNELGGSQRKIMPQAPSNRPGTVPSTTKAPLASGPKKAVGDWLGIGNESPGPSPAQTPIGQRKRFEEADAGGDPFSMNLKSGPSSLPQTQPDMTTKELRPEFLATGPKKPFPNPFVEKQQQPPPPPLKPKLDFDSESGLPSFLDRIVNRGKATPEPQKNVPNEGMVGNENSGDGIGVGVQQKKRVVTTVRKVASASAASTATLQVPSHVIDEDELKRMSSSLKQLYENQVEMLEKSYKEQMDCLVQSYSRKEEMLKEEIKMIHKDYEERLSRLKGDLADSESKPVLSRSQNQEYLTRISTLSDQIKHLQVHTEILTNQRRDTLNPITEDINHAMDAKLSTFLNTLESTNLNQGVRQQSDDDKLLQRRLDGIYAQLESQSKFQENSNNSLDLIAEMKTEFASELKKLLKEQKKLRETLLKSTVTNMTQSLESKHEDHRKKDKITTVMKEFRKDVQRFMVDIDSVQKSQLSIEGEQKHISQAFHDLSTWLQVNQQHTSLPQTQAQSSIQNEFELKLLKEERNVLSETIAQMNVEKRRLHDEKIQFETDKRELDRQKLQLHDLETTLRIKLSDAEDSRKQAESYRSEHMKLTAELSKKMNELDKERMRYHDMTQTIELQTGIQKQRQDEERAEIIREREFLEKLRLQFLCPGCLRLLRSQGDGGVDIPGQAYVQESNAQKQNKSLDLEREGRQLNEMIRNYYGNI